MRLLYITQIDIADNFGYARKIFNQLCAFNNAGIETYLIAFKGETIVFGIFTIRDGFEEINQAELRKITRKYIKGIYYSRRLAIFCTSIMEKYNFEFMYVRRIIPVTPFLLRFIRKFRMHSIIFYEYPTFPWKKETSKNFNKASFFLDLIYYKKLLKSVHYIPAIYPEDFKLKSYERSKFIKIGNGIYVDDYSRKLPKKSDTITLLSVAYVQSWHAYDRIIKGLYEYYKNNPRKEVFYHCVGDGSELDNLKKLTKELGLEKYIIFHGTKTEQELDKVFDESDVAIGSLGFHRAGLKSGSPLKGREYCARGIPFVIAYDDQDFSESFPYILKIPSDESPVDINKIVEWYEELTYSHPDYSTEMRKYAEEHLSWDAKMKPVIEKIKEIAEEEGKSRP